MRIFETTRTESFITKVKRNVINLFPCYRRGGGRIIFLSSDIKEIHVKIGLNWQTRNYVGSVFGGSLYAAIDPMYMLQLLWILGDEYIVWDRAASMKFIRPVKTTVYAKFEITDDLLDTIKTEVTKNGRYIFELPVMLQDKNGEAYYTATKQLYVATKEYHKNRQK